MDAGLVEMTGIIAIDAGQTGMKVRVLRAGSPARDSVFPGIRTHEPLVPQLAAVARAAVSAFGDADPSDTVVAGISGLTDGRAVAEELHESLKSNFAGRVIVAHDSITSYLGALGDRVGAVVAVGTGVVTLGVGPTSVARVDGWGNVMGDAGSGYWIGREALDVAMRAYDGRGSSTAILDAVRSRWPDIESAYIQLQSAADRVPLVASFARVVGELADVDSVARGICERAGAELALSVATALRRVGLSESIAGSSIHVAAIGGVLSSLHIRRAFERALRGRVESAVVVPARGDGVAGAVSLAQLGDSHPLLQHAATAAARGEALTH